MRGVILAGGTGSRLMPLTEAINKHLLPVGQEPMIFQPIRQLVAAGIDEILVVTGGNAVSVLTLGGANDKLDGTTLNNIDVSCFHCFRNDSF